MPCFKKCGISSEDFTVWVFSNFVSDKFAAYANQENRIKLTLTRPSSRR